MNKIAIVQHAPHVLDREATLGKAVQLIKEAAAAGARLIVLPEAFVPGYPAWVWRLRPGGDWDLNEQLHRRLLDNAVNLADDGLAVVRQAAAEAAVTVVMGLNERDGTVGRSTLFNTAVVIGADGQILNHHRKLMPTNPERMIWGFGDGAGLRAIDTRSAASGCCCAGKTTCPWRASPCTPRASTSTSRRPTTAARPGPEPCSTSRARAAAG